MAKQISYQRELAVEYAKKYALSRNPAYLDFSALGGDCTNFISQCVYAGCGVMNETPTFGWYYRDPTNRAPAWTSVEAFYRFLTKNTGAGPQGILAARQDLEAGDVIELGDLSGRFYHAAFVLQNDYGRIYLAAHSIDSYMRPLESYAYSKIRYLRIVRIGAPQ